MKNINFKRLVAFFVLFAMIIQFFQGISVRASEKDSKVIEIFKNDSYEVNFVLDSKWNTGYNATITIENTGEQEIEDWVLALETEDNITNLWNGTIETLEDGIYTIKNNGWNQDIPVNKSISFGFTASYTDEPLIMKRSYKQGRYLYLSEESMQVENRK